MIIPTDGRITQYFDTPVDYMAGRTHHEAIDIVTRGSKPVIAIVNGTITKIIDTYTESQKSGYGNEIFIKYESGLVGRLCHMKQGAPVKVGQFVEAGETIGHTGRTGYRDPESTYHTHYEEYEGTQRIDPLTSINQIFMTTLDELYKQGEATQAHLQVVQNLLEVDGKDGKVSGVQKLVNMATTDATNASSNNRWKNQGEKLDEVLDILSK